MFTSEGCALPVGSCCTGVPIELHFTFFLLLILNLLDAVLNEGQFSFTIFVLVFYGPVLLVTVIAHELGHVWMNKKYGKRTSRRSTRSDL